MTNPIYTADAIASVLCYRAMPSYEGQHPKAALVAQEAARLMVGYTARACQNFAVATDSFESDAREYVRANLPRELKRAPTLFAFITWPFILSAIISSIVQALIEWYFQANDSDELRAALRGMA